MNICKDHGTCMAVALVAMLLACCLTPMVVSEDSDAAGADATIELRVGDTFSYTPTTKLASTFSISGTATDWLDISGSTISGTATEAGSTTLTITASNTEGPKQPDITQTIDFIVYERIVVSSGSSATAIVGQAFEYTLDYDGPSGTAVAVTENTASSWLTWNGTDHKLTGTPTSSGTATVTFTITSPHDNAADEKVFTVTINTFADIAITSDASSETYVGADYEYTVTSNVAGSTFTADTSEVDDWLSWSSPVLSGEFDASAVTDSTPYYNEYTVTFGASGTQGDKQVSTSMEHTIRVYINNAFLSTPTISDVDFKAASGDTKQLLVSAAIEGATKVTISWGDDTEDSVITPQEGDTIDKILEDHTYTEDGVYTVTITAENDQGRTVHTILYDTTDGSWTEVIEEDGGVGKFIGDNSLLIALAIAAALFVVLALMWSPYAWIGFLVCVAAIAACLGFDVTSFGDLKL